MAQPSMVFIIVDTPDEQKTRNGLPPTSLQAWAFPIEGTIADTVKTKTDLFPAGSKFWVTTDARCDKWKRKVTLEQDA